MLPQYPLAALAACPSWPDFPAEPRTAAQVIAWHDLTECAEGALNAIDTTPLTPDEATELHIA